MSENTVLLSEDRETATVCLNRPDKHNAFDDTVIEQLYEAFNGLAARDDIQTVILSSTGKSFSAGADLGWMKRMASYDYEDNLRDAKLLAAMLKALYELPQTTIAKVQGAAFGGAVGLVSCCDIAIASEAASFSLSEVKIGLIPATISPYVIRVIGERASRRYFATGERFDAAAALNTGLIGEIVPQGQLDQRVADLVKVLGNNSPQARREAKVLINVVVGYPLSEALVHDTCERIAKIRVSEEGQEGLGAFLEKRKPNWIQN